MKDRIKKYVNDLFSDIYETKQLQELKEEVSANLLDKINDYIAEGHSENEAFNKAAAELGDMSELMGSLKKVSIEKMEGINMNNTMNLSRKHVIGYLVATAVMLFGLMSAGIVYLQSEDLMQTIGTLMPFIILATPMYVYFGLTQESIHDYGMSKKRAAVYSLTTAVMLFGLFAAGFVYFSGSPASEVLAATMPFVLPATLSYIYLGLTEKSRRKMDTAWQQQWVNYYSDPETMMVRGSLSGALWIFAIAAFLLIGFLVTWKLSWIVFVFAVGFEVLMEAYFSAKRRKK